MKQTFKDMDKIVEVFDDAIEKLTEKDMKKTIFLVASQFILSDFNPSGMSPEEVLGHFLTHNMKGTINFEFAQSSTGHYSAGWGRSVWILKGGVFEYYGGKEDSSG